MLYHISNTTDPKKSTRFNALFFGQNGLWTIYKLPRRIHQPKFIEPQCAAFWTLNIDLMNINAKLLLYTYTDTPFKLSCAFAVAPVSFSFSFNWMIHLNFICLNWVWRWPLVAYYSLSLKWTKVHCMWCTQFCRFIEMIHFDYIKPLIEYKRDFRKFHWLFRWEQSNQNSKK